MGVSTRRFECACVMRDRWIGIIMTYLGRVEVRSFALVEPVMTVQLQFGTGQSGPAIVVGSTRSNSEGSVVASLENPCELLHWVIHVQPDIRRPGRRSRRDGLCAGELGHSHEILMARLAEAFPLGGIQVDERGVEVRGRLDRGIDTVGGHVRGALERNVEANLVVLECNCKTGVEWYTSECVCVRSRVRGEKKLDVNRHDGSQNTYPKAEPGTGSCRKRRSEGRRTS